MPGGTLAIQMNLEEVCTNYYRVASFALLYYDYLLTIDQEIKFFWKRPLKFADGLFFACRYLTLFGNVPGILQTFSYWPPDGCRIFQRYHQILIVTVQLLVSTTLITRTYALYERSRRVLALTCFTALCVAAIAFWALMRIASTDYSPLAFANMSARWCNLRIDEAAGTRYGVAWVGVVVFDTEILILTAWKTIKILRTWKKVHLWSIGPSGGRIAHVFLRDGCVYYGILTVVNMSQVLTFLYSPPLLKGLSTTFVNVISVSVISRLMLNLRDPNTFAFTVELGTLPEFGAFKVRGNPLMSTGNNARRIVGGGGE